jgi:glucan 1,3-beta-glucosidase
VLVVLPAILFGWALETAPIESITLGAWLRSLAFVLTAAASPIACAAACAAGRTRPAFAALSARSGEPRDALGIALGVSFIALTLLSLQTALGLVFDPRYRDLPFAPLFAATFAFLVLMVTTRRLAGPRAVAETLAAGVLAVSAIYIAFNESFANWQAMWLCGGFVVLALILAQARDAPD